MHAVGWMNFGLRTTMTGSCFKDLYSTAPKRGSVFIGLMTPDGAIWFRYQRTVLMR